jgi:hypothetical protein
MKKIKTSIQLSLLALGIPLLCAFESAPTLIFVSSNYSGHEEITRQALNNTIQRFKSDGLTSLFKTEDFTTDLDAAPKGLFGSKSRNMLIHGNFATDFPNQTSVLSLGDFWQIPNMSYFENPKTQVMHFLRNYKSKYTLESAQETCMKARQGIKFATEQAVKAWLAGDKTRSLFLLGHVTHTIQDSFSAAHSTRDGFENNYNLKNICFYGDQMSKAVDFGPRSASQICYHTNADSADVIWNTRPEQQQRTQAQWPNEKSIQCDKGAGYPETEEQKQACLKHEARLARLATEKYLYIVFAHLNSTQRKAMPDFINSLDSRLFQGPVGEPSLDEKMSGGIMRCDGLSPQEVIGSEPQIG